MLTNPSIPYDLCIGILILEFTSIYLLWVNAHLAMCLNSVLNVKALVGAFSVIVILRIIFGNLRLKLYSVTCSSRGNSTSPASLCCSSSMVETMKVKVEMRTIDREKNAQNLKWNGDSD